MYNIFLIISIALALITLIIELYILYIVVYKKYDISFRGEWYWIKFRIKSFFRTSSKKTQIEHWKEFAEALIIRSGVDLENVMVHNLGNFGFAGRGHDESDEDDSPIGYVSHIDKGNKFIFKIEKKGKPYLIVPEIVGWWSFRAWIHEIGHQMNSHYCKDIDIYIKEYEAEKFCLKFTKKCRQITIENYVEIKYSAYEYLTNHIIDHFRNTIDKEIVLPTNIKKFLPKSYITSAEIKVSINRNRRFYSHSVLPKYE